MTPDPQGVGMRFYPDDALRTVCEPVELFDDRIAEIVATMVKTMRALDGAGLAAPQLGVYERIIVLGWQDPPIVAINPRFVKREGSQRGQEGCLSMPEVYEQVERAKHVKIEMQDAKGRVGLLSASDFNAVCVQHEIDHLNGVLFIDHVSRQRRRAAEREWLKVHQFAIADVQRRIARGPLPKPVGKSAPRGPLPLIAVVAAAAAIGSADR